MSEQAKVALSVAVVAALLLVAGSASAQVPVVSPDGTISDPAAPPPAPPPPPPTTIVVQPDGSTKPADTAAEDESGFYYTQDYGLTGDDDEPLEGAVQPHSGPVPPVHVVRRGDTLWDISSLYYSSPWEWPRVWSYNPEVTNPHWIYPGDQVRLRGEGEAETAPAAGAEPDQPVPASARRPAGESGAFDLRQLGFVASEELEFAIEIEGSPEEKVMLATGDEAYLSYPEGRPPKVGQRLSIYQPKKKVHHPKTKEEVGAYVTILGELEVASVRKDKVARAVILDSVDAIERGMKVGPLQRQFKNVKGTAASKDLEGTIVADLHVDQLIGARQVVILDRGARHGMKVGNRLYVVRRGDAYEKVMGPRSNIGKNDPRYPARSLGEVMVVQTGARTSVAVVTQSSLEFGIGDRVLLVRGR
jgi:LysM repeat protein